MWLKRSAARWQAMWYQPTISWQALLLLPFSGLFFIVSAIRRLCYRLHLFKVTFVTAPVIVVGNIVVGGTGKTPFVIWLTAFLKQQGYRPGIISRGVGGKQSTIPRLIDSDSVASNVGDEALMLSQETGVPVVVSVSRVLAAQTLLALTDCNIIISDDGMQHYALGRDIEIALIDKARGHGNGCLLPAGPLRESIRRLDAVDIIVEHGDQVADDMLLTPISFRSVLENKEFALDFFAGQTVHAVCGIGHPARFFATLGSLSMQVIPHIFPDHHSYKASDLAFDGLNPVIMTQKDAVKCRDLVTDRYWFLAVAATISKKIETQLLKQLERVKDDHEATKPPSDVCKPDSRRRTVSI